LENATAHVRRHGSLFRICTRRLNVKTKMLITASFVAVATMIAANAKAGPNNVDGPFAIGPNHATVLSAGTGFDVSTGRPYASNIAGVGVSHNLGSSSPYPGSPVETAGLHGPLGADDLPIYTAAAGPAGSPTRGPSDAHSPRATDDGQVFGPREVYVMVPHS
jgi:hypothetical protein